MNVLFKIVSATHIALFRLTGGRVGSSMRGQGVLLLTTTGSRSGQPRTVPVMHFDVEGRRYVVGSAGGAPQDPAWIKNLRKTPEVGIELRGEKYRARASILTGDSRAQIFKNVTLRAPFFGDYATSAGRREIPVVELTRI